MNTYLGVTQLGLHFHRIVMRAFDHCIKPPESVTRSVYTQKEVQYSDCQVGKCRIGLTPLACMDLMPGKCG